MAGGDENSTRDMGALIAGADKIRNALKCAVLLVHHTTKSGELERGSSALRGAVDTLLSIKRNDQGTITLKWEKHKDAPEFRPIELELTPHLESVVITAKNPMAVDSDELNAGELDTLRHLAVTAPPEGLAATRWLDITEKKQRTFWNHRKRLDEGGYILTVKAGGITRYVVSNKGTEILGGYCHGTAI